MPADRAALATHLRDLAPGLPAPFCRTLPALADTVEQAGDDTRAVLDTLSHAARAYPEPARSALQAALETLRAERPPVRLEGWYIEAIPWDRYTAPELRGRARVAYPDPDREGKERVTGAIEAAEGRTFRAADGRRYELGEPDANWLAWMAEQGIAFDPANPIRVRGGDHG